MVILIQFSDSLTIGNDNHIAFFRIFILNLLSSPPPRIPYFANSGKSLLEFSRLFTSIKQHLYCILRHFWAPPPPWYNNFEFTPKAISKLYQFYDLETSPAGISIPWFALVQVLKIVIKSHFGLDKKNTNFKLWYRSTKMGNFQIVASEEGEGALKLRGKVSEKCNMYNYRSIGLKGHYEFNFDDHLPLICKFRYSGRRLKISYYAICVSFRLFKGSLNSLVVMIRPEINHLWYLWSRTGQKREDDVLSKEQISILRFHWSLNSFFMLGGCVGDLHPFYP